ncbi:MAG: OmpA family protein [Spirochaetaceae bacterium]|jgi:outer membrane protein OmpA-like peptidoglycan-associated protein|nr:OmpA family protein [Spirochaetaceae bacterium]
MQRKFVVALVILVGHIVPFAACATGNNGIDDAPVSAQSLEQTEPVAELAQAQPLPSESESVETSRNLPQSPNTDEQYFLFFEAWTAKLTGEGLHIPELYDVSTTLSMVLKIMQDNPEYRLLIEGFANPVTGSVLEEGELYRLSLLRAQEAEARFVRDGISPNRLITVGEGGISNPYDNSRIQQAKNRRVQMTVIKPQGNRTYTVKFEQNYAAVTSRDFYIREQLAALEQLRDAVDYIKANPDVRVLVQGFELPREQRRAPISKQRADEVTRLLRRELRREGVNNPKFIVIASGNVQESAAEVMILPPLPKTIP